MDRPIQGSWEDLLDRALTLTENRNDGAVELLEKLIAGLNRLPDRMLDASDERLRNQRRQGVDTLVRFHASKGRFTDALHVFDREAPHQRPQELAFTATVRASLLWLAGDADAAGAVLDQAIRREEQRMEWLSRSMDFMHLLQYGQVDRAERWMLERLPDPNAHTEHPKVKDGIYRRAMEANIALARGKLEEALSLLNAALKLDPDQWNTESFATELIMAGRPDLALPIIHTDNAAETSAYVWKALALRSTGRTKAADKLLQEAAKQTTATGDDFTLAGACLAHYYLGDKEELGIAAALEAIDAGAEFEFVLYPVAGIGWAIQGDLDAAKADLETAVALTRWELDGRLLHKEWWFHCTQLLPPDRLDAVRPYFDPTLWPNRFL